MIVVPPFLFIMHFLTRENFPILFVVLVSDVILQVALESDVLTKFGGGILHTLLTNAICCTMRQLAALPLSTKRAEIYNLQPHKYSKKIGAFLTDFN